MVSVIVASRNRRATLERLIGSLRRTAPVEGVSIEVLIVDNASTDDTFARLESLARDWTILRPLQESTPGKNFALNKGLRESRGDVICLMDDDILLDSGWLRELVRAYREGPYDALQPRVLPGTDPEGRSADMARLYIYNIPVIDYGDAARDLRGLTGVIMSFRREVMERAGTFDERLPASGYEGDTDISRRIREKGFSIGYAPRVVAYHELDPKRYGIGYARLSQYRKGLSRSLYGPDSILFNVVPNLCASAVRYAMYRLFAKEEKVYKTEKRIMKYWGYLVGRIQRALGREPWV